MIIYWTLAPDKYNKKEEIYRVVPVGAVLRDLCCANVRDLTREHFRNVSHTVVPVGYDFPRLYTYKDLHEIFLGDPFTVGPGGVQIPLPRI